MNAPSRALRFAIPLVLGFPWPAAAAAGEDPGPAPAAAEAPAPERAPAPAPAPAPVVPADGVQGATPAPDAALPPAARPRTARHRPSDAWRNRVFERDARALASVLGVGAWTAADLLADDEEVRARAAEGVAACQRRRSLGTGLLAGGGALTIVGAVLTGVFGGILAEVAGGPDDPDRVLYRGLGAGIGLLSAGLALDAAGIGALAGRTAAEEDLAAWYRSRR